MSDEKLELAKALGATHTFNAGSPNCKDEIRQASGGGVAFAFEFAGSVRALELAYGITRRGGMTVTAGLPPPSAMFMPRAIRSICRIALPSVSVSPAPTNGI